MIRRRHAIRALLVLALIAAPAAAVIPQSAKIADAIAAALVPSPRALVIAEHLAHGPRRGGEKMFAIDPG